MQITLNGNLNPWNLQIIIGDAKMPLLLQQVMLLVLFAHLRHDCLREQ